MIFDENTVIELVKNNQVLPDWVCTARERTKVFNALVYGIGFEDVLIKQIEHLESSKKATARKKYSKDIRDVFARVLNKRSNVFEASGGSEKINITNESIKAKFVSQMSTFKYNKSIFQYLSEYYFKLLDTDPNGIIFLEYDTETDEDDPVYEDPHLEPTYKCIDDIRNYDSEGQMLQWVIFEPETKLGENKKYWRVVDDLTDWSIIEQAGVFYINTEKTFKHPFGKVPAVILSEVESVGDDVRLSVIDKVSELSKDCARDKSILTIYKFQNGFPVNWRFVSQCKTCAGTGKTGKGDTCETCDGKGYLMKSDVTDLVTLPIPKEGQPNIAPNIAGYISPDLETWRQYKQDLIDFECKIHDTIWGTETAVSSQNKTVNSSNKTATQSYIDVQPVTNTLNDFSNKVEYVHNTLANFVLNFIDLTKDKKEKLYHISYGRRYILESPDIILDRYQKSKEKGDNNTILDKILEEYVLSKYKNDPTMQEITTKKIKCEPYIHLDINTVNTLFGRDEALKKVLFQKFWETVNTDKTIDVINQEFLNYFNNEKSNFVQITV